MKKFILLSSAFIFLQMPFGYALESNSTRIIKLEEQVEDLQEKLDDLLVKQSLPSTNPSMMGDVYFVTLDVIRWHAHTNGTAFAYSNSAPSPSMPLKGRTKDIHYGWDLGLRAGVGKNLDHDRWDLYGTFTAYCPHFSGSSNAGCNATLIPLKGAAVIKAGVTHAKSSYDLETYQIDAELGRHYYVSSKLSFRPFAGVKNVWINQNQKIRYTGGSIGINSAHIDDSCEYWGIGLRGGVNSKWHLNDHFYLKGLFSGALLYGFFDIDHKEKLTPSPFNTIKIDDNKHRFVPTVQWSFGLNWGDYLGDQDYFLDLGIAYEGQYFWRLNQMINIYEYSAFRYNNQSDDVSMHGITLSAKLYF